MHSQRPLAGWTKPAALVTKSMASVAVKVQISVHQDLQLLSPGLLTR